MPIPKTSAPLGRKSAKEQVFDKMREWIITGQLHPGEQLYDMQLAEYFQVSRTPVREAFLLLESQGLVSTLPGRATIVTDISSEQIKEYYLPLAELQGLAAELVCDVVTQEQLEELYKKNQAFRQATFSDNTMKIILADAEFHGYLADISGNRYVSNYCRVLLGHVTRLEYLYFSGRQSAELSAEGHDRLLELIKNKDKSAGEILKKSWLKTMAQCEERLHGI